METVEWHCTFTTNVLSCSNLACNSTPGFNVHMAIALKNNPLTPNVWKLLLDNISKSTSNERRSTSILLRL